MLGSCSLLKRYISSISITVLFCNLSTLYLSTKTLDFELEYFSKTYVFVYNYFMNSFELSDERVESNIVW